MVRVHGGLFRFQFPWAEKNHVFQGDVFYNNGLEIIKYLAIYKNSEELPGDTTLDLKCA